MKVLMKRKVSFLALLLVAACGPSRPKIIQIDPEYHKYVSGYTAGMISNTQPIRIELANEVPAEILKKTENDEVTDELLNEIIEFEPAIDGKLKWVNSRTIEFTPATTLSSNQFYTAYFKLNNVANVERKYKTFAFQFATYPQDVFVDNVSLEITEEYNPAEMTLTGQIKTTDYADSLALKKVVYVLIDGKKVHPDLTKNRWETNVYSFQLNGIRRQQKEKQLQVFWDGKPIQSDRRGSKEVKIPALGDFSLLEAEVIDNEDQFVEINFSEPISPSQNLDGIITIEGQKKLSFEVHGNRVKVFLPNRIVGQKKLTITTGLQNINGNKKDKTDYEYLRFHEAKPMLRMKGTGSILPNSQGLIFPFEAVGLKSVSVRVIKIYENNIHNFLQINNLNGDDALHRFGKVVAEKNFQLDDNKSVDLKQWSTHVIDLQKLISPDPGAIYRVSIKFTKEDAICECDEDDEDDYDYYYSRKNDGWNDEHLWKYGAFGSDYDSWYYYSDSYSPCNPYYYRGKAISRNILASDLGVIFKLEEDKTSHIFVSNMLTTEPVASVDVTFYDFTKQVISSGKTDGKGMFTSKLDRKPFLVIVKNGKQRGYLKLGDAYANAMNKFDINGTNIQKGVKGFLYAERGVWRPGDSLYVAFILENKDNALPKNHPVGFTLEDPYGNVVYQTTSTKNVNGTYDFRCKTDEEGITGNYLATATVGNNTYTKYLKVETIKPNRLKIKLDVEKKNEQDTVAKLKVEWLHGAIAKNLKTSVQVQISQGRTVFDNYKKYIFDSPLRSYSSDLMTVVDKTLNENGTLVFSKELNVGNSASGKVKANYITKVFEPGGDFSIDRTQVEFSPFKTYIGVQAPTVDNFDGSLETDKKHVFNFVAVSEDGKLKSEETIEVKIYKLQWSWWYENSDSDMASYISRNGSFLVKDSILKTKQGKASISYKVNYPDYGKFLIIATDTKGNHQTGLSFTIDWPYWNRANRVEGEHANLLNFTTNKSSYTKGENIQLSIPSPAAGKALVSIETRSKVIKKYWINTQKGETLHILEATADMAPNAYIHITLIQPHANTKNDLPIRLYGVTPVSVDDPMTHLHPIVQMPEVLKPETKSTITVNEKQGRKMTYTIAVVDEGLLDLTNFKTPQPWNTFYAKEALGVKTWDMYDYVIGAFAGKMSKLLTIGGDGEAGQGKNPKANRFKPMVRFMGPFTVEAGQSKNHSLDIPNYVGSVRVMVVAQNNGAYGNCEKTVPVKKPLMLLATCPRVFGPDEEITLPISVFAMEDNIKNVTLSIEGNDLVSIIGNKTQSFEVKEQGELMKSFQLKVSKQMGIAKLKITAVSGKVKATEEIEIDVRASNPIQHTYSNFVVESGSSKQISVNYFGLKSTNEAIIEVSRIPSIGLQKRLDYLIQYPHGCLEQTTSGVFPQLYLGKLTNLTEKEQKRIKTHVQESIKRLQLFQTGSGGFSYWPGENYENEWATNYAGHFLLEAEIQGYVIPEKLKNGWVRYQTDKALNWNTDMNPYVHKQANESHQLTQAYRLYLLALAKKQQLGAMNRLKEERNLAVMAKWQLAAAYAEIGQEKVGQKMVESLAIEMSSYRELSYTFGSNTRDEAIILQSLSKLNNQQKAQKLMTKLAGKLNSDSWLSTQETAMCLLALTEYAGVKNSTEKCSYSLQVNGNQTKQVTLSRILEKHAYTEKELAGNSTILLKNTGGNKLYVSVTFKGVPLHGTEKTVAENLKMSVVYLDMNNNKISPEKLKQGTDFMVEVTVTNPGNKGIYKEIALNQLFPSGWEILNDRMDGVSSNQGVRYQDVRDDRVYSYFELGSNASKTIRIRLNASYLGIFYLPAIQCETMYDNNIFASEKGKWVEVVK